MQQEVKEIEFEGQRGWFVPMYPRLPEFKHAITRRGAPGLPKAPGVYFVYSGQEVVYVGQSRSLKSRVSVKHANISYGDMVSWLELPESELNFAESFFIGILRPERNFGKK